MLDLRQAAVPAATAWRTLDANAKGGNCVGHDVIQVIATTYISLIIQGARRHEKGETSAGPRTAANERVTGESRKIPAGTVGQERVINQESRLEADMGANNRRGSGH